MVAFIPLMLAACAFGGIAGPEPESETESVADVLTPEILARVIGESGGLGVWGTYEATHRAWRYLMHAALNRYRQRHPLDLDDDIAHDFLRGFYRLDPSPPPEAIKMAEEVLVADEDPTEGCMFALSKQDLELLGIEREADMVLSGHGVFSLNFFREWPVAGND